MQDDNARDDRATWERNYHTRELKQEIRIALRLLDTRMQELPDLKADLDVILWKVRSLCSE